MVDTRALTPLAHTQEDFALMDTDNSGALSKDEVLQLAVRQLGKDYSNKRYAARKIKKDMLDDFFSKVIHVCMLGSINGH